VVAALFPNGTLVNASWNGGCMDCGGGWGKGAPLPMPMPLPDPGVPEKGVVIQDDVATDLGPTGTGGDVLAAP
jgi:hypothetical protein